MTLREIQRSVWLRSDRVGTLFQRGDSHITSGSHFLLRRVGGP
ncbi:MAG: hypothetical protein WAK86_04950 [Pseudonocardiaceae bacterium]